ncbi:MAG TPA: flavin reductase family protein [Opitutaceae bacterium]|nr:flavin reductase family protein [Opitutaceae bacterium]
MTLDFEQLPPRESYPWMINAITPRPIAWVSTVSAEGRTNLAPFSFFQGVCANPPTLLFSGANDRHGNRKDTIKNVEAVPEFVVNIVPYALREKMNATSAPLPHGESEFERFGIGAAPALRVAPPRVATAPAAFECRVDRIVRVGEGPLAGNIVIGRILCLHVDESVLGPDGRIDPARLDTIGRMGGEMYARTTDRFEIPRPG